MKKILVLFILLSVIHPLLRGQAMLTPEEAVSIALKNNYDILVSRTSADIDKLNNTAGNAGMLPGIGINGSDNYSLNNVSQDLSDGSSVKYSNTASNTFNAGIDLGWTLFDGGRMFATKKKLNEIEARGEILYKDKVMQTAYDVTLSYFNVVKQKQQLASDNEVINYGKERVKILQASFNAGLAPKTDLLQAQIDLNVNLENAVIQEALIIGVKRVLNQLLSRDPETPFEVSDSIINNYSPDRDDLLKKLFPNNTSVLAAEKDIVISQNSLREFQSLRYPVLNLNAGYNYLLNNNTKGTTRENQAYGPQIGGTLTIPIYEGGNINRQVNTAKLQLETSRYNLESVKLDVNTQLQNAFTAFEYQKQLLKIEKENTALVKENLEISMHRLRLGQTTALEVRQAQESFEESHTRLINFQYNLKAAETKLKQLIAAL